MQSKNECTIVVLGARNTGKTEIVEHYVFGANAKPTRPTIEEMYQKQVSDGRIMSIIDTCGEESTINNLRDLYATVADGYVIMFNINDQKTICRAKLEYEHLQEFKKPIIVVATFVGATPVVDLNKKRALFRDAAFFCINLGQKQNCSLIFETLAANMTRKRRKFCCFF